MPTPSLKPRGPTSSLHVFSASSSEEASLQGHKAKTPIIAGSVCAIVLVILWSIALISYIVKRRKKKVRAKKVAAGVKPPKPVPPPPETYIIPPDPAVVLGQRQPGERVVVEPRHKNKLVKHSKTMPGSHEEMEESSDAPDRILVRSNTEPFSRHADDRPLVNGDSGH